MRMPDKSHDQTLTMAEQNYNAHKQLFLCEFMRILLCLKLLNS